MKDMKGLVKECVGPYHVLREATRKVWHELDLKHK